MQIRTIYFLLFLAPVALLVVELSTFMIARAWYTRNSNKIVATGDFYRINAPSGGLTLPPAPGYRQINGNMDGPHAFKIIEPYRIHVPSGGLTLPPAPGYRQINGNMDGPHAFQIIEPYRINAPSGGLTLPPALGYQQIKDSMDGPHAFKSIEHYGLPLRVDRRSLLSEGFNIAYVNGVEHSSISAGDDHNSIRNSSPSSSLLPMPHILSFKLDENPLVETLEHPSFTKTNDNEITGARNSVIIDNPNINPVKKAQNSLLSTDNESEIALGITKGVDPIVSQLLYNLNKYKMLFNDHQSRIIKEIDQTTKLENTIENEESDSFYEKNPSETGSPAWMFKPFSRIQEKKVSYEKSQGLVNNGLNWQPQNASFLLEWEEKTYCWTNGMDRVCADVGVLLNGDMYPRRQRIRRATKDDDLPGKNSTKGKMLSKSESKEALNAKLEKNLNRMTDEFGDTPVTEVSGDKVKETTVNVAKVIDFNFCPVPKNLKTAELLCTTFPDKKVCKSYCAYGQTYEEGIVRTSTCKKSKGSWFPAIRECKPFVDCRVRVSGEGKLKCTKNTMKSPKCFISCDRDDINAGVQPEAYECQADGTWKPPLPFCGKLFGTLLVKAPEIKEHTYPLTYPRSSNKPYKSHVPK